jgi:hypothetical protein
MHNDHHHHCRRLYKLRGLLVEALYLSRVLVLFWSGWIQELRAWIPLSDGEFRSCVLEFCFLMVNSGVSRLNSAFWYRIQAFRGWIQVSDIEFRRFGVEFGSFWCWIQEFWGWIRVSNGEFRHIEVPCATARRNGESSQVRGTGFPKQNAGSSFSVVVVGIGNALLFTVIVLLATDLVLDLLRLPSASSF